MGFQRENWTLNCSLHQGCQTDSMKGRVAAGFCSKQSGNQLSEDSDQLMNWLQSAVPSLGGKENLQPRGPSWNRSDTPALQPVDSSWALGDPDLPADDDDSPFLSFCRLHTAAQGAAAPWRAHVAHARANTPQSHRNQFTRN